MIIKVCPNFICLLKSLQKKSAIEKMKKIFFRQKAKIWSKKADNSNFSEFICLKISNYRCLTTKFTKKGGYF